MIDFQRGDGPGHQVAKVYGVQRRALKFHIERSMDDPKLWVISAAYSAFGVRQDRHETDAAEDFLDSDTYLGVRGPHPSLREAKKELRLAWRAWTEKYGVASDDD